jgi:serine/threonine protein kinase
MPNLPFLTEAVGTSGYTAPEMFDPQRYSFPADVFSAAVVGWEIMSRRKPDNPLCGHDPDVYVQLVSRSTACN